MLIYDVEIVRCIPEKDAPRREDLEYCEGWTDYAGMGVSVACVYDVEARSVRVFLEDNLAELVELARNQVLVGFNNHGFDDHVLAAAGVTWFASYDLLAEIRAVADGSRTYVRGLTRAGRKLADVCAANLASHNQKTGSGAHAPELWQKGRRGEVIDYCIRDVLLLAKVIAKLPRLIDPATGRELSVRMPAELVAA
jgi:hypothetical protein